MDSVEVAPGALRRKVAGRFRSGNPIYQQANLNDLSPAALDALEGFLLHVVDSRAVGGAGVLLEREPTDTSAHELVERPTALLGASQ